MSDERVGKNMVIEKRGHRCVSQEPRGATRMSALECADQASPRACTVKAPHIASLATKAFFGRCQNVVSRRSASMDDPLILQ